MQWFTLKEVCIQMSSMKYAKIKYGNHCMPLEHRVPIVVNFNHGGEPKGDE